MHLLYSKQPVPGIFLVTKNTEAMEKLINVIIYNETHMFYKRKHNSNKISNMWVPSTCPAGRLYL